MLGLSEKTKIHFIGIGGIGMSGIAEVLLDLGHRVSGSDLHAGPITDHLASKGAEIHIGHAAGNLNGVTIVVYSTAIDNANPEIMRAKEEKIPIVRRAEMLAELMRLKKGVAIAGSHGKTTTTSMVATIFHEAGLDPTHIIGGIVSNLGGNARKGNGEFLIAEADESDGSFLLLSPVMAVVTNIDNDHLDFHKTEANIRLAFVEFINKLPFFGRVALNAQDPGIQMIMDQIKRPYVLFGMANKNSALLDYAVKDVAYAPGKTVFEVLHKGESLGMIETRVSGEHNVLNAAAAIAICHEAGIGFSQIASGIRQFVGVGRRLESLWKQGHFEVIDDYGHHPTEIRATLKTVKDVYRKPVCVVFEPHRYSRTQQLWDDFLTCFDLADEVFIAPIYAASEKPIDGITAKKLVEALQGRRQRISYISSLASMKEMIEKRRASDMVFLTLGAGSISKTIKSIVKAL